MAATESLLWGNRSTLVKHVLIASVGISSMLFGQSASDRLGRTVDELLDNPSPILGPEATVLTISGDSVAATIRRHRDLGTLTRRQVKLVLYMVTGAFQLPGNIALEENRIPRSSMLLLQDLKQRAKEEDEAHRIEAATTDITKSLEQFKASQRMVTTPSCRVFFEVSSASEVLKYIHIDMPGVSETFQTDEQGKARLRLPTGQTQTYHFTAPGFQDASLTLSCVGTEYLGRQVVLVYR